MCGELNNQVLVEKICYDLGYNLENFISDSTFAFFYEIRQKDENIGFIYQGNNHPSLNKSVKTHFYFSLFFLS
jgi:hypothetical protein